MAKAIGISGSLRNKYPRFSLLNKGNPFLRIRRNFTLSVCILPICSISFPAFVKNTPETSGEIRKVLEQTGSRLIYFGAGAVFKVLSGAAQIGQIFCSDERDMKACELLGQVCAAGAKHAFAEACKKKDLEATSDRSWRENFQLLSHIPVSSPEDEKLLHFLQERWLAKIAGFSAIAIDWVYPCFGIRVQTHPGTNHSYARLLTSKLSSAYTSRMEAWKASLPHPSYFPLILTRPTNLKEFLPSYTLVESWEQMPQLVTGTEAETIVDVSSLFSASSDQWRADWEKIGASLSNLCLKSKIDPEKILCVQKVSQEEIGGLRLLHLQGQTEKGLEKQHQMLLEWLSALGLGANRIELDRWPAQDTKSSEKTEVACQAPSLRRHAEALLTGGEYCTQRWEKAPSYKKVILQGTLRILEGVLSLVPEEKWGDIASNPTQNSVVHLAMAKMETAFGFIAQSSDISFTQLTAVLELIHADLSSLLEVLSPFTLDQFPSIYRNLLYTHHSIPQDLCELTSCGIHTTGMTALSAIVKAVERTVGVQPRVLFGDNTYFECAGFIRRVSHASCMTDASDPDWEQADLLITQFNPVLKLRGEFEYKVEPVADSIHKALKNRKGTPLTVAIDCTIDFLHSPRLDKIILEFAEDIRQGTLNLIGFRSGNKFDLFGMDNYCGAPIFMIHNKESKWHFFDEYIAEKGLATDRLSLSWFCAAYKFASNELDIYRKHIFENTRSLLSKVPKTLFDLKARYRISPAEQEADLAFIDVKIAGPFHAWRCAALVAAPFYLTTLESGHPMFNRPSLGFYHPNCKIHFVKDCSVIRLTLGLDPTEVDLFAGCLQKMAEL